MRLAFPHRIFLSLMVFTTTIMNAQTDTNKHLDARQQSMVVIAALTATGDVENLKIQLNFGLDSGLTVNEIKEMLVQLYAYCGFPRSLNAINSFKAVLDERKTKDIDDAQGKEIMTNNDDADKYEQGRQVLETLTGMPQPKPAPGFGEFAPRIDAFLKEHLFADIFASNVLTYQQRELITISALAAMTGVVPQLQAHLAMGKHTGLTNTELLQAADLIEKHINKTQADILRRNLPN